MATADIRPHASRFENAPLASKRPGKWHYPRQPGAIRGMSDTLKLGTQNEQRGNCDTLRRADGSHYSCCGFPVLQRPVLGTANSEYRNCLNVRSFLLDIPEAS